MPEPDSRESRVAGGQPGRSRARGGATPTLAVAAAVVAAWLVAAASPVTAETGQTFSTASPKTGVDIDTRWVGASGYRPVRVTITPKVPSKTDQTFTMEMLFHGPYHYGGTRYDLRVARDIELLAGSTAPVQASIPIPQHSVQGYVSINVLENGKLARPLCPGLTPGWETTGDVDEMLPAVLMIGEKAPDTSQLGLLLPLDEYEQARGDYYRARITTSVVPGTQPEGQRRDLPTVMLCKMGELPKRWIEYSSLDIVCLSLGQLRQLSVLDPAALRAVIEWTAAGGNLWVYGMGDDWRGIAELEAFLGLGPGVADADQELPPGWSRPDEKAYLRAVRGGQIQSLPVEPGYAAAQQPGGTVPPPPEMFYEDVDERANLTWTSVGRVPSGPHFLYREYDTGMVVALAAAEPFPGSADDWRGVLNTVGADRWLWYRRHGMSTRRDNPDYWNFLIPGVGLVPVTEFCVLITVFVLAIGPVNYWLLRRLRRLHLLVLTIPLGASAVTLGFFAYALLADGLGTRVRVRSATCLDQGRGQAVCWSRQSYYSGLTPHDGLSFPDDMIVLPLEPSPLPDFRGDPAFRELIWRQQSEGDQQWLASGWLRSREPMQLLTVRSRPSRIGLELSTPAGNPGGLQVKNRLATRIRQLVVCADDGKLYWAEGIAADQTAELGEFTPQDRKRLRQLAVDNQPQWPEGMDEGFDRYGYGVFPSSYYYAGYYGSSGLTAPEQGTGRLERCLAIVRGLAEGGRSALEPGSYLAIVDKSPEVVIGVAPAREEDSFHVILGKW